MINDASVVIGGGNWGIKEADVLGYKLINEEYYARDIDFANSTAAGTYTDSTGVIRKAPYNLLLQSNTFSNAAWLTSSVSVTSGQAGYDGTNNAWLLTSSLSNGFVYQNNTIDGINTFSIYGKAGTNTQIILYSQHATQGKYFDLSSGTVGANFVAAPISASIENVGGGWYRCSIVVTASANAGWRIYNAAVGTTFIQNAQAENGDIATDYFPTTTRLNVPRIDYRNADGSLSTVGRLLLEPQRTNLVPNGLSYNSSTGVAYNTTVSGSPMAGVNCARITKNEAAGTLRYAQQSCSSSALSGSTGYVLSAFFKYDGVDFATAIEFNDSGNFGGIAWRQAINIASTGITLGTSTSCTSTIENWGSGWYRVNVRITTGATPSGTFITYLMQLPSTLSTGQGFLHALPQFEAGAYPTTYIPTTTAAVTRNADVASKTGVSSWIGQTEGTLFLDFIFKTPQANTYGQIAISDPTSPYDRVLIWNNSTFNTLAANLQVNGSNIFNTSLGTFVDGQRYKIALAYKSGSSAAYVNGTQVFTNSSTFAFSSTITDFILGAYETAAMPAHQLTNQALLFPTRLSNSQLQSLTTL